jgi:hypothetical protein
MNSTYASRRARSVQRHQGCVAKVFFAIGLAVFLNANFLLAQGSLTPPGAPAPSMKSLVQVEPRIAITNSGPVAITRPGSYYLTTNITVSSSVGIHIQTNNVTIDLNGFSILCSDPSPISIGIYIINGLHDIYVFNGHIAGGVTNNAGVYGGPGFVDGIYANGGGRNIKVSHVSVSGCLSRGIIIGVFATSSIESCQVDTVGSYGLWATTIRDSVASGCGDTSMVGETIVNCFCTSSSASTTINGLSVQNCYAENTMGPAINARLAQNCSGSSTGTGRGLSAFTAINCAGSASAGDGLFAQTAQNCFGQGGGTGRGIFGTVVQNCYGSTTGSGAGIAATVVNNCYAFSSTGPGISGSIVTGSYGSSTSGPGITTITANGSLGFGTPGVNATYKYNMP